MWAWPINKLIELYYWFRQWTSREWWSYLLEPVDYDQSRIRTIICRAKGHPYGVVWYTTGDEPDMTCKNCGDDLG